MSARFVRLDHLGRGLWSLVWFVIAYRALVAPDRAPLDGVLLAVCVTACVALLARAAIEVGGARTVVACLLLGLVSVALLIGLSLYRTYLRQGGLGSADAVRALGQTDLRESLGFLASHVGWEWLATGFVLSGARVAFRTPDSPRHPSRRASFVSLCAWSVTLVGAAAAGGQRPIRDVIEHVRTYRWEAARYSRDERTRQFLDPVVEQPADFDGTVVLVIGESLARSHMGLYGYLRDTTPELDRLAPQLVVFRDVISPHSYTSPALGYALYSIDQDEQFTFLPKDAFEILSLARSAGYRTVWLSNQNEYGIWDNPVTALARRADETRFFSSSLGEVYRPTTYDADMLPAFREALRAEGPTRRLIVLHLFANHWNYCANHPREWRHFQAVMKKEFFGNAPQMRELNCHDDGVRYVDAVVAEVVEEVLEAERPSALVFFSDHGEAPLFDTKHDSVSHSSYQIEIPLIFAANRSFRTSRSEVMEQADKHRDHPYSTARLFHSLADLLGVHHPSVRKEDSLFDESLVNEDREALNGSITYDRWSTSNDYRENSRATIESLGSGKTRVWAHRVNSLGALLEAKAIFSGIEVDAVFEGEPGRFSIRHPPVEATGLTLEQMLAASKDRPNLAFWIDWKNASEENLAAALDRLEELDRRFDIRRRILVETGSRARFASLASISGAAFRHGYYLPTERVLECMEAAEALCRGELAADLRSAIQEVGATAVTYDWRLRSFVEDELGSWLAERGLEQFSWDESIGSAGRKARERIEARLRHRDLSAILIEFPSAFWI